MHQCSRERSPRLSPTKQRVKELLDKGLTVRDVAALLNISTQAVYKHMKQMGLTPPQRANGEAA